MQRKVLLAFWCAAALALLPSAVTRAQSDLSPAEENGEVPQSNYRLKKVSLALYGGRFSGGTFFELPKPGERTELDEGVDVVYRYDGLPFTTLDPHFYSAPRKRIESGSQIGGSIGFYVSEDFHVDLQLAVASAKATTSFLYDNPRTAAADPVRIQVDEDPSFKVLSAGGGLGYNASKLSISGITPYIGCAFGGVINRFSHLEDKTALFFQVSGGFYRDFGDKLRLATLFSATTFSFEREELRYGKQVTYGTASISLSYMVDMIPRD